MHIDDAAALLAEQCLAEFNERFKVPKAIFYHALHLLDDQQRLVGIVSQSDLIGALQEQLLR